jgi:hypothetical protein
VDIVSTLDVSAVNTRGIMKKPTNGPILDTRFFWPAQCSIDLFQLLSLYSHHSEIAYKTLLGSISEPIDPKSSSGVAADGLPEWF